MTTNNLEFIRERLGMTQRVLAREAKVSHRTITRIEAGHEARWTTKHKILKGLGVPREFRDWVFHVERSVEREGE